MQKSNNDFFLELKAFNARFGGQWSEEEEKDLYRQFWEMSRNSHKSAYDIFLDFQSVVIGNQTAQYEQVLSIMDELNASINLPYTVGPKVVSYGSSSHNKARAMAAKAKQRKRLEKKRKR